MALTLVEASKLSQDLLLKGVIETIIKDSPILQRLPFIELVGDGLTYNRENTLPTVDFYAVGDTWAESTPTFTKVTSNLAIMGGDADVDNFLKATRSNVQDVEAAVIELKSKAARHKFEETFIYGDSSTNAKQFDGLRKIIDLTTPGSQVVCLGPTNTGDALAKTNLIKIDATVDKVLGGKPDMLLMSKATLRAINDVVRQSGGYMASDKDEYGNVITRWNGIPMYTSDWILDTHAYDGSKETATTTGNCSVLYAFQLGEGALSGLTGPGNLVVEPVGQLETKDATRTRIKWYVSLALFSTVKAAALIGIKHA